MGFFFFHSSPCGPIHSSLLKSLGICPLREQNRPVPETLQVGLSIEVGVLHSERMKIPAREAALLEAVCLFRRPGTVQSIYRGTLPIGWHIERARSIDRRKGKRVACLRLAQES